MFRHQLVRLRKNIFLRHTAEETCGSEGTAGAKTLHTAFLFVACSTAVYCAPVWCPIAYTRLLNSVLNDVGSVVKWLRRRAHEQYGLGSNPLAPFCCVLGKDTLRHFPLLDGLGEQF